MDDDEMVATMAAVDIELFEVLYSCLLVDAGTVEKHHSLTCWLERQFVRSCGSMFMHPPGWTSIRRPKEGKKGTLRRFSRRRLLGTVQLCTVLIDSCHRFSSAETVQGGGKGANSVLPAHFSATPTFR